MLSFRRNVFFPAIPLRSSFSVTRTSTSEQNEADKANLDEFIRFVASQGRTLDLTSVAGLGCLKDRHLDYLWDIYVFWGILIPACS